MLGSVVYERLYEIAKGVTGTAVEVGTGHGAGAVCMALAGLKVHTFDRFEGGSRAKYGDAAKNLKMTRKAIAHFGVSDRIEIIKGDVGKTAKGFSEPVSMLFLDCDGRVDRDFANFLDLMPDGAPVVIDDHADKVRAKTKNGYFRIDQKHRLTFLLVNSMVEHGLLEGGEKIKDTWFGRKAGKFADWPQSEILGCYRQLVFADAKLC